MRKTFLRNFCAVLLLGCAAFRSEEARADAAGPYCDMSSVASRRKQTQQLREIEKLGISHMPYSEEKLSEASRSTEGFIQHRLDELKTSVDKLIPEGLSEELLRYEGFQREAALREGAGFVDGVYRGEPNKNANLGLYSFPNPPPKDGASLNASLKQLKINEIYIFVPEGRGLEARMAAARKLFAENESIHILDHQVTQGKTYADLLADLAEKNRQHSITGLASSDAFLEMKTGPAGKSNVRYAILGLDERGARYVDHDPVQGSGKAQVTRKPFDARAALEMNALTSPGNLFGESVTKAILGGAEKSASTQTAKLAEARTQARKLLMEDLRGKGFSEAKISQLMHDLDSRAPEIARAAMREMRHDIPVSEEAIQVIQKAADHQLLSALNLQESVSFADQWVHDKKTMEGAIHVFDEINPATLNELNRPDALEAALAGSAFGAAPKLIAEHINHWDRDGLEELSAAYERTAEKLTHDRAFTKLKSEEEQELYKAKVLRKTLDDMRGENEEARKIPEGEWNKMRSEMMGCAIGTEL